MAAEADFHLVAIAVNHIMNVFRPEITRAHLGTAQGVEVMHDMVDFLCLHEGLVFRQPEDEFRGGLCTGGIEEFHFHTVHHHRGRGFRDLHRWLQNGDRAGRGAIAEAGTDIAFRAFGQEVAEHIGSAAAHRVAGKEVLADRLFIESLGGDDRDFPLGDFLLADDPLHTAEMVGMAMGEDNCADREILDLFFQQFPACSGGINGQQRVNQDPAGFPADEAHHREIEIADLIDIIRDLEEPADMVELALTPEARIGGLRRIALQEIHAFEIIGNLAISAHDRIAIKTGDEAAIGIVKIRAVIKGQLLQQGRIRRFGMLAGLISRGSGGDQSGQHEGQRISGYSFHNCFLPSYAGVECRFPQKP